MSNFLIPIKIYDPENRCFLTDIPCEILIEKIADHLLALATTSTTPTIPFDDDSSCSSSFLSSSSDETLSSSSLSETSIRVKTVKKSKRLSEQYKKNLRILAMKLTKERDFVILENFWEDYLAKDLMTSSHKHFQMTDNFSECKTPQNKFHRRSKQLLTPESSPSTSSSNICSTPKILCSKTPRNPTPYSQKNLLESPENYSIQETSPRKMKIVLRRRKNERKEKAVICCICGLESHVGFMIECAECNTWQHGICMDLSAKVPDWYLCSECEPRELTISPETARNLMDIAILEEKNFSIINQMSFSFDQFHNTPTINQDFYDSLLATCPEFVIHLDPIPEELLAKCTVTYQTDDYPDYFLRNPNIVENATDDEKLYYIPEESDGRKSMVVRRPRLLHKDELLFKKFQMASKKRKELETMKENTGQSMQTKKFRNDNEENEILLAENFTADENYEITQKSMNASQKTIDLYPKIVTPMEINIEKQSNIVPDSKISKTFNYSPQTPKETDMKNVPSIEIDAIEMPKKKFLHEKHPKEIENELENLKIQKNSPIDVLIKIKLEDRMKKIQKIKARMNELYAKSIEASDQGCDILIPKDPGLSTTSSQTTSSRRIQTRKPNSKLKVKTKLKLKTKLRYYFAKSRTAKKRCLFIHKLKRSKHFDLNLSMIPVKNISTDKNLPQQTCTNNTISIDSLIEQLFSEELSSQAMSDFLNDNITSEKLVGDSMVQMAQTILEVEKTRKTSEIMYSNREEVVLNLTQEPEAISTDTIQTYQSAESPINPISIAYTTTNSCIPDFLFTSTIPIPLSPTVFATMENSESTFQPECLSQKSNISTEYNQLITSTDTLISATSRQRTPTPVDPWTTTAPSTSITPQHWTTSSSSNLAPTRCFISSNQVDDVVKVSHITTLVPTTTWVPPQPTSPSNQQHVINDMEVVDESPQLHSLPQKTLITTANEERPINFPSNTVPKEIIKIPIPNSNDSAPNGVMKKSTSNVIFMTQTPGYFTLKERPFKLTKNMLASRILPCADIDIRIPLRHPFDPVDECGLEPLYNAFRIHVDQVRQEFNVAVDEVQHLFIADTLYWVMNHKIFENTYMIRIEAPALSKWLWTTKLQVPYESIRLLHKFHFKPGATIFYGLGLDFLLYYAGTLETTIDLVKMELNLLLNFCTQKANEIGANSNFRIVFVTVPEIGHFDRLFKAFNNALREYIYGSTIYELLDWADACNRTPGGMQKIDNRLCQLCKLLEKYDVKFKNL